MIGFTGAQTDEANDSPSDESEVLDLLVDEFLSCCRRGEWPSIIGYEERYPEYAARIRHLFPMVETMERLKRGRSDKPQAVSTTPPPVRIGEFQIVRELGRGGMAVVYEAVQGPLGRTVALKVLRHTNLEPKRRERFDREARAVAKLHHTNIVPIFAFGVEDSLSYYAMQLIEGRGLDEIIRSQRENQSPGREDRWRSLARVGIQVAEALQFAHDHGVFHRDVKPSNLLVDEHQTAWITDFGLAKLVGHEDLSATGDVIGTLRYLAPEALHGETGPQSDVYGLGLTLYEWATLSQPFGEVTPSELLCRINEDQPTRPRSLAPEIPDDLETIILKAIAREPSDRYQTASHFADDLRAFLDDRPIKARKAGTIERTRRWVRRNQTISWLAAMVISSLMLAAIVGWKGYVGKAQALNRADKVVTLSLEVFSKLFAELSNELEIMSTPIGPPNSRRHFGIGPPPIPRPDSFEPMMAPISMPPPPHRTGDHPPPPWPPGKRDRDEIEDHTVLLKDVLTFYERFARLNETNVTSQGEAAWAYFRVGAIYQRLGKLDDANGPLATAVSILERLAERFPSNRDYQFKLAKAYEIADPWLTDPEQLPDLEPQFRRAVRVIERLIKESPSDDADHQRLLVRAQVKLGTTLHRLDRNAEAVACYQKAISLLEPTVEKSRKGFQARLNRVDARHCLATALGTIGDREQAVEQLDAAVDDLQCLFRWGERGGPISDRLSGIAETLHGLGEVERSQQVAVWADEVGLPPDQGKPRR